MKSLIVAASALALAGVAAPAFAQSSFAPTSVYGNLGGAVYNTEGENVEAVQGRLGARFGRYVGAEGELAFGVNSKTISGVDIKLKSSYAGYAVGFLPVAPNVDLLARVGYGHATVKGSAGGMSVTDGEDTVNYGAGAQVFLTPNDAIRADYTRYDIRHDGGNANVWALSYVRKFN